MAKRLEQEDLLKFLEEHAEYREGFLFCKKAWCKKTFIGKNLSKVKGVYYQTSINGMWYRTHRLIYLLLNKYLPEVVDHADRNKFNNSIENLRSCTKSQNERNRDKYSTNTSGYRGVWFHKQRRKWCAEITVDGKSKKLGLYTTAEEAAMAYNAASLEYHGEFGFRNVILKESINDQ